MYNKFMNAKELKVKTGDRVKLTGGWTGTVIEVIKGKNKSWNGANYIDIPDSDFTSVRVHIDKNDVECIGKQYQDSIYGAFWLI